MATTLPTSTPEQRAAALAKAARYRTARAEMKELLRTGSLTLGEVFDRGEHDDIVGGMKLYPVLYALPRLGKVKAKRLMEEVGIADNRRVRALTDRQRTELLEAVG